MPDRYISDTNRKCVTVNTTVLVPVVVKVYPTMVTAPMPQQLGSGTTTPIHKLPKSFNFANTGPYIYHYNPASSHPNSTIVSGALVNNMAQWDISLSDEPSGGVSAYVHIEPDTTNEVQEVGFDLELPANVYVDMRVRQYVDTGEEYVNAVSWTSISESGPYHFALPVNKAYVKAGGPTILEMTFRTFGSVNIGTGVTTKWNNYYTYISHYVPQTHIATICEEKDNYRFGFNGKEKDNEAKGIGNSLDFGARIYDSRLGRWLSLDPLASKYPGLSPYHFAGNSPIVMKDPDGKIIEVYYNGQLYQYTPGVKPAVSNEILDKVHEAITYNMRTEKGREVWTDLHNSKGVVIIQAQLGNTRDNGTDPTTVFVPNINQENGQWNKNTDGRGNRIFGTLFWDYRSILTVARSGGAVIEGYYSPSTALIHEAGHGQKAATVFISTNPEDLPNFLNSYIKDDKNPFDTPEEERNIKEVETPYIKQINSKISDKSQVQPIRKHHGAYSDYLRKLTTNVNSNVSGSSAPTPTEQNANGDSDAARGIHGIPINTK